MMLFCNLFFERLSKYCSALCSDRSSAIANSWAYVFEYTHKLKRYVCICRTRQNTMSIFNIFVDVLAVATVYFGMTFLWVSRQWTVSFLIIDVWNF